MTAAPTPGAAVFGVARSLSGRRWLWRESDARLGLGLAQRLGLPEIVGRLLVARGIGPETAPAYLEPRLRLTMPDPASLIDMEAAADRLAAAVRRSEHIGLFGDYDVDGVCATALMARLLSALGCRITTYVPDRLREGYGPHPAGLAALHAAGARLILCLDCGIAAAAPLAAMKGKADIIILDHHRSQGPLPEVAAAVNPNRPDCPSGLGYLCATAVAFLAAAALLRRLRRDRWFAQQREPDLLAFLDLVALATVCDVMPLTGFNRAVVAQGLKVMERRQRPGIVALLELAGLSGSLSTHALGFILGPRINAAGRIGEPDLGLRLLLTEDGQQARALAEGLEAANRRRQTVEAEVLTAAQAMAEAQLAAGRAVLLLVGEGWHPGVVGIVAGRLKDRFNRPVCVAGRHGGMARGSGRSVPGVDLGAAVAAARQAGLLESGGGHAMAAGFAFRPEREEEIQGFLEHCLPHAAHLPRAADLLIEGMLEVRAADGTLAQQVARLAPFGPGNDEPLFAIRRARVVKADRIGKEGGTIRAFIEGEDGGRLRAICFRASAEALATALLASGGAPLHLCGYLRAETWNGAISPTLQVVDAALA